MKPWLAVALAWAVAVLCCLVLLPARQMAGAVSAVTLLFVLFSVGNTESRLMCRLRRQVKRLRWRWHAFWPGVIHGYLLGNAVALPLAALAFALARLWIDAIGAAIGAVLAILALETPMQVLRRRVKRLRWRWRHARAWAQWREEGD